MIPFLGESLGLFYAWSSLDADESLGGQVHYRGGEAGFGGTRALPAGESWRVWVAPGSGFYLEEADLDLAISWAVEVDSGTVTVAASEGIDPEYGDFTAAAPTDLGVHTFTGPGTLLIPSTLTTAQVLGFADGAFMLKLDATAGAAVVSQVKLRVWPTTGAGGGWSDTKPSFDTNPTAPTPRYAILTFEGTATNADPAASWDTAMAAYLADVGADSGAVSRDFSTAQPTVRANRSMGNALSTYTTDISSTAAQVIIGSTDPAESSPIHGDFIETVDWIRPPTEVNGDTTYYVQALGDRAVGWVGADIEITTTGSAPPPGSATLFAVAGDWDDEDPSSGAAYTFAQAHGPAVSNGTHALPTNGSKILVQVSHSQAAGAGEAYPGWVPSTIAPTVEAANVDYDLAGIASYVTLPPYRLWSPTAQEVHPLRLMQRGDGLGMGSGRILSAGTRQNSTRVLGTY